MGTLSVAMIVKNEAHCLSDCLDSIRDIADEIVIGDTGSTDETAAVAQRYAAKVFSVPWRDDFAAARNAVLDRVTGNWVLHLDADEVVDPAGARRIREIVDNDAEDADAVDVLLANYSYNMRAWRWIPVAGSPEPCIRSGALARDHAGYIPTRLPRLFRNGRGYEYREAVHESITESIVELGGVVRIEPIVIHHYGLSPSPEKAHAKDLFYSRIATNKVRERPDDPKAWCDLAEQSFACGDTATAEEAARKALAIAPNDLAAATILANIQLNRGDLPEARALFEQFDAAGITAPHVAMTLGAIACHQGRLEEALQRLVETLRHDPHAIQARLYLARVFDRMGAPEDAHGQLQCARESAPGLAEISERIQSHDLRREGERLLSEGNAHEALRSLVAALRLDNEDPVTHHDIGLTLTELGLPEKAEESFQRARKLAPALSPRT